MISILDFKKSDNDKLASNRFNNKNYTWQDVNEMYFKSWGNIYTFTDICDKRSIGSNSSTFIVLIIH